MLNAKTLFLIFSLLIFSCTSNNVIDNKVPDVKKEFEPISKNVLALGIKGTVELDKYSEITVYDKVEEKRSEIKIVRMLRKYSYYESKGRIKVLYAKLTPTSITIYAEEVENKYYKLINKKKVLFAVVCKYFDTSGNLTEGNDGYAISKSLYDNKYSKTTFYNQEKNVVSSFFGYAVTESKVLNKDVSITAYYDSDGRIAMNKKLGYSIERAVCKGKKTVVNFYDNNGNLVINSEGCSFKEYIYTSQGTTAIYYFSKGNIKYSAKYDKDFNMKQEAHYRKIKDNTSKLYQENYYKKGKLDKTIFYTSKGKTKRKIIFNPDLEDIAKTNYYGKIFDYFSYYSNGKISIHEKYDKRGDMVYRLSYYKNGKLYSKEKYNKYGDLIEKKKYDPDGNRIIKENIGYYADEEEKDEEESFNESDKVVED